MSLLSKICVCSSLLLIIFAYSPTIISSDYVSQDQWRAFRYSTLADTPTFRAKAFMEIGFKYYLSLGRPLVWFGEIFEHAFVSKIKDFVYLLPVVLLAVLASVIYGGSVIGPYVGGMVMGVMAFSLFVLVPGYSYIYFMGMSGLMQLLCIPLSAASFLEFNRWADRAEHSITANQAHLIKSVILFIVACMIYPSWAYIVFIMALFRFGFDNTAAPVKRLGYLGQVIFVYAFASFVYFLLIRVMLGMLWHPLNLISPDSDHQFQIQLNPAALCLHVKRIISQFYNIPVLNFYYPFGGASVILGLFSIASGLELRKKDQGNPGAMIAWGFCVFLLSIFVLIVSMSPWLISNSDSLPVRCLLPLAFFVCAASIGLIGRIAQNLTEGLKRYIPFLLTVFILAPSAMVQNNLSSLETAVCRQEIGFLRSALGGWFDNKGYDNDKFLLIVRPQNERPSFVGQFPVDKALGDNAVLASAENPIEIPWMVNAVLREKLNSSFKDKIMMIDCSFDQVCDKSLIARGYVVLGITNGDEIIRNYTSPLIINFSLLTSRPVYPAIIKFQKTSLLNPWVAEHYINIGRQDYNSGDLARANDNFTKAIEINPEDAEPYLYRGIILGSENKYASAIILFSKAIGLYPKYAEAYYNRAGTYYLLKEYDQARRDVLIAENSGFPVDPQFINALRKASGKIDGF